MCYRCSYCGGTEPPRHKMKKVVRYRTGRHGNKEVEREIPICSLCEQAAKSGPRLVTVTPELAKELLSSPNTLTKPKKPKTRSKRDA